MAKLIVTLMILAPAVALAGGGGDDYQYEQNTAPKVVVNLPADDGNGAIIAAIVAGVFGLGTAVFVARRKS